MRPCIISSETQTIEEAKELYQEFKENLPLEPEPDKEGEENNVIYVSPDCKWVITNKWSEYKTIKMQMLFYDKGIVRERVNETRNGVYQILVVKDGEQYREMNEEHYNKLSELKKASYTMVILHCVERIWKEICWQEPETITSASP